MKKNKKGFTLVELLAVIAIIGVISLIGAVSMNVIRRKIELKTIESNLDLIIAAAKTYAEDNIITGTATIKVNGPATEISLVRDTDLTIDSSYYGITVRLGRKNYRATACINKTDSTLVTVVGDAGGDITNSRVNEENLQRFLCP